MTAAVAVKVVEFENTRIHESWPRLRELLDIRIEQ